MVAEKYRVRQSANRAVVVEREEGLEEGHIRSVCLEVDRQEGCRYLHYCRMEVVPEEERNYLEAFCLKCQELEWL